MPLSISPEHWNNLLSDAVRQTIARSARAQGSLDTIMFLQRSKIAPLLLERSRIVAGIESREKLNAEMREPVIEDAAGRRQLKTLDTEVGEHQEIQAAIFETLKPYLILPTMDGTYKQAQPAPVPGKAAPSTPAQVVQQMQKVVANDSKAIEAKAVADAARTILANLPKGKGDPREDRAYVVTKAFRAAGYSESAVVAMVAQHKSP